MGKIRSDFLTQKMQVIQKHIIAYLIYFHKYLLDHHKEKKIFYLNCDFRKKSYLIHSQNHLFLLGILVFQFYL